MNKDETVRIIDIFIGSKSDLPECQQGLQWITKQENVKPRLHICCCHRDLFGLIFKIASLKSDVIVAGAGMSNTMPGIIVAIQNSLDDLFGRLGQEKRKIIPVIGVAFTTKVTAKDQGPAKAAISAIKYLQEPPLMKSDGEVYVGSDGFLKACQRAAVGVFTESSTCPRKAIFDFPISEAIE